MRGLNLKRQTVENPENKKETHWRYVTRFTDESKITAPTTPWRSSCMEFWSHTHLLQPVNKPTVDSPLPASPGTPVGDPNCRHRHARFIPGNSSRFSFFFFLFGAISFWLSLSCSFLIASAQFNIKRNVVL